MKILIGTPVFKPMVGGMETMANNLAMHFTERGHEVTVVTPVPYTGEDTTVYRIIRQPSFLERYRLAKAADVVLSNGANLFTAPWAILAGTPVVMRHSAYHASLVDGAGWHDDRVTPLTPMGSVRYHLRNSSFKYLLRSLSKLAVLRSVAKYGVATNVAISDWMKNRHPLPRQIRIHNPFPITRFEKAKNEEGAYAYDFFFLGRLTSEKGVEVLLEAFAQVQAKRNNRYRLGLIGDGPLRKTFEAMVDDLGQRPFVTFLGTLTGDDLVQAVKVGKIAVLPSNWEEPFGGVATEILAAEKNMIVSRDGALSEIVADAGLTFPNQDADALADAMLTLIEDERLQKQHVTAARARIRDFDEDHLIEQYLTLFHNLTK